MIYNLEKHKKEIINYYCYLGIKNFKDKFQDKSDINLIKNEYHKTKKQIKHILSLINKKTEEYKPIIYENLFAIKWCFHLEVYYFYKLNIYDINESDVVLKFINENYKDIKKYMNDVGWIWKDKVNKKNFKSTLNFLYKNVKKSKEDSYSYSTGGIFVFKKNDKIYIMFYKGYYTTDGLEETIDDERKYKLEEILDINE